ncbi:MAG TPA: 30S ribosomal protein S20 [Myxococcota bacterium]|nr:30S ribosomal protein S20 [Myxococcota bacterium]
MANHPSAEKRHLQSLKRNARNRAARAALATQVKKARLEIAEKKTVAKGGEVHKAVKLLAKSARKGLLHKKAMSRRISRMMKQANAAKA